MKRPRTPEEKSLERQSARARRQASAPLASQSPVAVHHYNPFRDVACKEVKIPYGEIFVGEYGSRTRSHEMAGSTDCFIPASQSYAERKADRDYRVKQEEMATVHDMDGQVMAD